MEQQSLKLGFVGLGAMGLPMAANLVSKSPKGSVLYVYDISNSALSEFSAAHGHSAIVCRSPREVAEKAEIVFTMLPEGSHVRSVYLSPETGITGAKLSAFMLVDCSTVDKETCLWVADQLKQSHQTVSFYDAPVSGGTLGAQEASLTFMVGGADDGSDPQYQLLHRLLRLMGKNIVACGGLGLGLTAKLCNNYCSGLIALATAEAMNIGIRSGMNPRLLARVFSSSTAQSTISDKWNPVPGVCASAPSSHGYQGGFKVQLMAKDFGLAVAAAKQVDAKLLLGSAGLKAYKGASEDPNCRDLDSRVVYRFIGGREDW